MNCGTWIALASCLTPLSAQSLVWSQQSSTAAPSPRYGHAMAYDSARQRVVLFGGVLPSGAPHTYFADTWEWDGSTWSLRPTTNAPSPRSTAAIAYDSARQCIVLFGGTGLASFGDTWEWDGTTWNLRPTPVAPPALFGASMTYDAARQRTVLFGGSSAGSLQDAVWEWDGAQWLQIPAAIRPAPRFQHGAAFDPVRQRVVVFGGGVYGIGAAGLLDDTWEWDGSVWTARTPTHRPPARFQHAMSWQTARQRIAVFGGRAAAGTLAAIVGDTWEWDGVDWHQASVAASPSTRTLAEMAHDDARDATVLFGGILDNPAPVYGDTWLLATATVTATASPFGAGCGTPPLLLLGDPNGRPLLAQTARANLSNAPSPVVAMAIGWSDTTFGTSNLPLDLTFLGMTGCTLLQSSDLLGVPLVATSPTTFAFFAPLPSSPPLVGTRLHLQAFAFAPNANPLQVVVSNALTWQLGNQ